MPTSVQRPSLQLRLYRIEAREQPRRNWAIFRELKAPKRLPPSPGVPAQVRRMMGWHRGVGAIKEIRARYRRLVCPVCHGFDSDKIFDAGFGGDISIHSQDDFAETDDYMFVVSQEMLQVLRKARVKGYEVKKIGKAGWHVLRVTLRVDSNPRVFRYEKARCKSCGRPLDGGGLHELMAQIEPPPFPNTFFTTKLRCLAREGPDRDLFCTEDVVLLLKENGIRKGRFDRLWTNEEKKTHAAKEKQDIFNWYPPKSTIWLS
jgi:hypothetical protein